MLMIVCPNGDQRASRVQYYANETTPAAIRSAQEILECITSGLMVASASSQPHPYPRHGWLGADLSMDDLGIVESCHRLLNTTFALMCAQFHKGAMRVQVLNLVNRLRTYDAPDMHSIADGAPAPGGDASDLGTDGGGGDAASRVAGCRGDEQHASRGVNQSDFAKINALGRRSGLAYCTKAPRGRLIRTRLVVEPLRKYNNAQLARTDEVWEYRQRANVARDLREGKPHTEVLPHHRGR